MGSSITKGKVLSLLHIGYSIKDSQESRKYYIETMKSTNWREQFQDAPYLGKVNGIEGAIVEQTYIEYGENRPTVELLAFKKPLSNIVREYLPGEPAYSQFGFRTADIDAFYQECIDKGLSPLSTPSVIDYGFAKGRRAFIFKDSLNMYVQVTEDKDFAQEGQNAIDTDQIVLSVPNLDDAIITFRDLLEYDVEIENVENSKYLSSYCARSVKRIAVCRSRQENFAVELWETGDAGDVKDLYINHPGSIHLCYQCAGIDDLYEKFTAAGMRFVNEPVTITRGVNEGSKAIFFYAPGYLWFELLCRKKDL